MTHEEGQRRPHPAEGIWEFRNHLPPVGGILVIEDGTRVEITPPPTDPGSEDGGTTLLLKARSVFGYTEFRTRWVRDSFQLPRPGWNEIPAIQGRFRVSLRGTLLRHGAVILGNLMVELGSGDRISNAFSLCLAAPMAYSGPTGRGVVPSRSRAGAFPCCASAAGEITFQSALSLYVARWPHDGSRPIWWPTPTGGGPVVFTLAAGDNWSVSTRAPHLTNAQMPTLVTDLKQAGVRVLGLAAREDLDADSLRSLQSVPSLCWLELGPSFRREEFLGVSSLQRLRGLQAHSIQLRNEDLDALKPLSDLCYLNLSRTHITDLSRLQGSLGKLEGLYLYANRCLNDTSVPFLTSLQDLRTLDLDGTGISEQGLRQFLPPAMPSLKELHVGRVVDVSDSFLLDLCASSQWEGLVVRSNCLTDAGMARMGGLEHLAQLTLACPGLPSIGLAPLAGLAQHQSLVDLDLGGCVSLDDGALLHLRDLCSLEYLFLRGCKKIGDAGLTHLENLTSLKALDLENTATTAAGRNALRPKLPGCTISPDP